MLPAGPRLLGAHVARGAQQAVVVGQARVGQAAGQAEVGDPDVPLGVDQQVRRLDVAVDHPLMMGMRQRVGRLEADGRHPSEIGRAPRRVERRRLVGAPRGPPRAGSSGPADPRPQADPRARRVVAMTVGRLERPIGLIPPPEPRWLPQEAVESPVGSGWSRPMPSSPDRACAATESGRSQASPGRARAATDLRDAAGLPPEPARRDPDPDLAEPGAERRRAGEPGAVAEIGRRPRRPRARRSRRGAGGGSPGPARSPRSAAWRSSTGRRPGRRRRPARCGCGAARRPSWPR